MMTLTEKEIETLQKARDGISVKAAINDLGISHSAWKFRMSRVREKLQAKTTPHAVAEAMSKGIIK